MLRLLLLIKVLDRSRDLCDNDLRSKTENGDDDMTYREELLNLFSDLYKDVAGFRPRGNYDHLTVADLQAECDSLSRRIERDIRDEHDFPRGTHPMGGAGWSFTPAVA